MTSGFFVAGLEVPLLVGQIAGMTTEWRGEEDSDWFGSAPHDIDPKRSVLIGELGYDRPIALDYRVEEPCVRFMTVDARWVKVADSIGALLQFLGMDVSS